MIVALLLLAILTVFVGIPYQFVNNDDHKPPGLCILLGLVTVPALVGWLVIRGFDWAFVPQHPKPRPPTLEERAKQDEIAADVLDFVVNDMLWNREASPAVWFPASDSKVKYNPSTLRDLYRHGRYPALPDTRPERFPAEDTSKIREASDRITRDAIRAEQAEHKEYRDRDDDLLLPGESFRLPNGNWFTAHTPISKRRVLEITGSLRHDASTVRIRDRVSESELRELKKYIAKQFREHPSEYIAGPDWKVQELDHRNPENTGAIQEEARLPAGDGMEPVHRQVRGHCIPTWPSASQDHICSNCHWRGCGGDE